MSEEYGVESGFLSIEEPYTGRSRGGSKPSRVRMTGLSFASLKDNIRKRKIEAKAKKYNEEYERLTNLAINIDEGREAVETGKMEYADVAKSIKAYNQQAKRLAEIGVQVLVLNQDIQKITFAKEQAAKAIRVPGFLIGPLRFLTAAGRDQARLEKEARMEKEQAIYESIVNTAEEAIGQMENSEIDEDKFESLSYPDLAETVANDLVTEPVVEPAEVKPVSEEVKPEPVEKSAEELAAEEKAKKEAVEAARVAVEGRNKAIDDALKSAYKKKPDPKKKREEIAAAEKAVANNDDFGVLAGIDGRIRVALVKSGSKSAEMLEFTDGKDARSIVTPSQFGKMFGVTDKEEIFAIYRQMIAVSKLASHWQKNATYETLENETDVMRHEAFGEELRPVFDYVVGAVREGMTAEEIKAKAANSELSEIEKNVVSSVLSDFEVVKAGVDALTLFNQPVKNEEKVEEPVDEEKDDVAEKRAVVDKKLAELAMNKYGRKVEDNPVAEEVPPAIEVPVAEEEAAVEETAVPPVETEEKTEETIVKPVEGSYVAQIGTLVGEIAELTAHRDRLKDVLGDEAAVQLDSINQAISNKLAQINELALGGIVSLGKDGEKKEEEKTSELNPNGSDAEQMISQTEKTLEEVHGAIKEGMEIFEKYRPQKENATSDAPSEEEKFEMSVEEKAAIDARVINDAHVNVDARLENFQNDEKFVINPETRAMEEPVVEAPVEEKIEKEEPVVEDPSEYYDRGILSEEDKADAIAWWSMMAPILDDPKQQALSEMNLAKAEKERAEEAADRAIETRKWEENRQSRIEDGWLPVEEEARTKALEEQEKFAEKIARNKLKHCKYFQGLDDVDATIDSMIEEYEDLHNARDVVKMISEKAPQVYEDMEEAYRNEKLSKLGTFENTHPGAMKK